MVEERLGHPLFLRTTRSDALTEAGTVFVTAIGRALAAVEEGIERLRTARGKVTGLLRLNAPHLALPLAITPVIVTSVVSGHRLSGLTLVLQFQRGAVTTLPWKMRRQRFKAACRRRRDLEHFGSLGSA